MFGDTKLSGIVKQEVSPLGELEYVGVMYFYGSKLPVRIRIKPSGHTQKGKLLYYISICLLQNTRPVRRCRNGCKRNCLCKGKPQKQKRQRL